MGDGHGSKPISSIIQHVVPTKNARTPLMSVRLASPMCQVDLLYARMTIPRAATALENGARAMRLTSRVSARFGGRFDGFHAIAKQTPLITRRLRMLRPDGEALSCGTCASTLALT